MHKPCTFKIGKQKPSKTPTQPTPTPQVPTFDPLGSSNEGSCSGPLLDFGTQKKESCDLDFGTQKSFSSYNDRGRTKQQP